MCYITRGTESRNYWEVLNKSLRRLDTVIELRSSEVTMNLGKSHRFTDFMMNVKENMAIAMFGNILQNCLTISL